jgi:hypothetical protein
MPAFEADGSEIPIPQSEDLQAICEIGGQFDECSIYIQFIHKSLNRDEITERIGLTPKFAWNAGERHVPPLSNGRDGRTRILDYGRWTFKAPVKGQLISTAVQELIQCNSALPAVWRELSEKWDGRLSLVGRAKNWNREFILTREVVHLVSERGLGLVFDAYFESDKSADEV